MTDIWVQIIFCWPAVIISVLLSITGVSLKKPILLVIAGIVCTPFTYYISNGFRSPILLLPLLHIGSAYAISRQRNLMAWLLIAPLVIVSTALAYAVLTQ